MGRNFNNSGNKEVSSLLERSANRAGSRLRKECTAHCALSLGEEEENGEGKMTNFHRPRVMDPSGKITLPLNNIPEISGADFQEPLKPGRFLAICHGF